MISLSKDRRPTVCHHPRIAHETCELSVMLCIGRALATHGMHMRMRMCMSVHTLQTHSSACVHTILHG